MTRNVDRSSNCGRQRSQRRPNYLHTPFLADEIWYLSSNSHFSWFCESAFLVDELEPVSLLGTPVLALQAHIPERLAVAELVNSVEHLDHIKAECATAPDGGTTTPALWRCNVSWVRPDQPIYSLAGYLGAELRLADVAVPHPGADLRAGGTSSMRTSSSTTTERCGRSGRRRMLAAQRQCASPNTALQRRPRDL